MKRQVELPALVAELQQQNLQKRDMVVPAKTISMEDGKIIISNPDRIPELDKLLYDTGISSVGDSQRIVLSCLETIDAHLAEKLGIPSRYFQKMREGHSALLDQNVTYWLQRANNNFLLRSFVDKENESGVARALLSDRFRTIDNYDVLLATLQAIRETGLNIQIDHKGCDITDKRLYLRFICPEIEIQAPELLKNYHPGGRPNTAGNGVISGFVISNSEVGAGALTIAARAKILACSNGLIKTDEKYNQRHLGAKMEEFSSVTWSEETKEKNLELIVSQIRDTIKHFVSEDFLGRHISEVIQKGTKELQHPMDTVKAVSTSLGFSEQKANNILDLFIKSGDLTGFGVTQAMTLYAHTQPNADDQFELEKQAAEVLEHIDEFDKPLPKKAVKTQEKLN